MANDQQQPPTTEATRLSAEREQEIRRWCTEQGGVYSYKSERMLLAELDHVRAENARLTEQVAAAEEGRQKYWLLWREMIGVAQRSYELFRGAIGSAKQAEAALAESRHEVERLRTALEFAGVDLIGFEGYFERLGSMGTVASIRRTLARIDEALSAASPAPTREPVPADESLPSIADVAGQFELGYRPDEPPASSEAQRGEGVG